MTQLLKTKGKTILKYFNKSLIQKYSIKNHSKISSKNLICISREAIKIKTNYPKFINEKENQRAERPFKNQIFIQSISKSNLNTNFFFNCTFDKGRLKNLILWFLKNYGQKKTIDLLEELKVLGYGYATKAGISLGIEDLKIPPQKISLLAQAEKQIQIGQNRYKRGEISAVERVQRLIDTWHQTSENLKQEVIRHFEATDLLNPVYMMAFSGARGNISQVRQLVGMRGLMSDPQGQIIDFPIRSNFREGLTLTEYIISTYGARKGIVDTALRTANAGYLTRRLVDVAQHVIVAKLDCGTTEGILVFDMKEGLKTIYSFQNRLIGRVLAKNVVSNSKTIAFRNQEISSTLAEAIAKVTKKTYIRSPLTCKAKKLVCQLCYGWSLANNKIVSIGEAVGIIAAQSIGEPGTQLTMRTFHTGGVFSGGMSEQLVAQCDGYVEYSSIIPGICVRTPQGDIAFLTKAEGTLIFHKLNNLNLKSSKTQISKNLSKKEIDFNTSQSFKIPPYSLLFLRHYQKVKKKQIMAQLSNFSGRNIQKSDAEQTVYSELEGQVYLSDVNLLEKFSEYDDLSIQVLGRGYAWILSGKIYQIPFNTKMLAKSADLVNKNSLLNQVQWINSHPCLLTNNISYSPIKSVLNSSSHSSLTNYFFKKTSKFKFIETINFAHPQIKSNINFKDDCDYMNKTYELNRNLNEISLKTRLLTIKNRQKLQNNFIIVNSMKNIINKNQFQFLKFTRISSIRIIQKQFKYFKNINNKQNFFTYKLNKRNTEKRNFIKSMSCSMNISQNIFYTRHVKRQSRVINFSMLTLTSKYKNKKNFIRDSKKIKNLISKNKFSPFTYTNEFRAKNKNLFIYDYEKSYNDFTYYPFQKYTRKYLLKLFNKSLINLTKKIVLKGFFENNNKNKKCTLIFEENKHFSKYRQFFEYDLLLQQQFNRKKKNLLVFKNTFSLNKWTIMNLIRNYVQKQTIQNRLTKIEAEYLKKLEKKFVPKSEQNLLIKKNLNDSFAILSKFSGNNKKIKKPSFLNKRIKKNDLNLSFNLKDEAPQKKQNSFNILNSMNISISNNIILKKSILLILLTNMNYRKIGYSFSSRSEDKDYSFFTVLGLNNKTQKNKIGLIFNKKNFQTSFLSPYQENYARKINSISEEFFQPLLSRKLNFKEMKMNFTKKFPLLTPGNSENRLCIEKQLKDSLDNFDLYKNTYNWKPYSNFILKWNPSFCMLKGGGIFYFINPFSPIQFFRKKYKFTQLKQFSSNQFVSKKIIKDYSNQVFFDFVALHPLKNFEKEKQRFKDITFLSIYQQPFFFKKTRILHQDKSSFFNISIQKSGYHTKNFKQFYYFIDSMSSEFSFAEERKNHQYKNEMFIKTKFLDEFESNKIINLKTLFLLPNLLIQFKKQNQVMFKKNYFLEKRSIKNKIIFFKSYKSPSFSSDKTLKSNKRIKIEDQKTKDYIYNVIRSPKYILKPNLSEDNISILKTQKEVVSTWGVKTTKSENHKERSVSQRTQKKLNLFVDQKGRSASFGLHQKCKPKNMRNQIRYSYSSKKKFSVNMSEIYWIPQENYEITHSSESNLNLFKFSLKEISDKRQILLLNSHFENLDIMSEKSKNSYEKISYHLNNIKNSVINILTKDNKDNNYVLPKKNSILFSLHDDYKKNTLRVILQNRQGKKKEIIPKLKGLIKIKKQKLKARNYNFEVKSILNSSICLSHLKLKFLKFIYKKYISNNCFKDFSEVKQINLYNFFDFSNNKAKLKEFLTQQVKLKCQFKNQTTYFNQFNLLNKNKMKDKLNSKKNLSLYKQELNHFNYLDSFNNKNLLENNNFNLNNNLGKLKYFDVSQYLTNMNRSLLKQDFFNSTEKVNISLHPGWVVILHKEKNYLKTFYHQSIHEFGNNLFEEIIFDTHSVYITNILLKSTIKSAEKSKTEINQLGLNKKWPSSFKVSKWIHSSFEDPLFRKKYNFVKKIKFLSKNDKKEMTKSFLQNKNEIQIFKSDLKILNSDIYQVLPTYKNKNRIVFFIRPMKYLLLPHIHEYKKQIYKLNRRIEEPTFSLLILENYFSSLLNKQKKDLKLISHQSKILLNLSTKIKLPILNKKLYSKKSEQIATKFNNHSFMVYRPFQIVQLKLMYTLSKNSYFKIPYVHFNLFSNLSLQGCQFYQSKKYQIYLRSILNRKNILLDSFYESYNKENKRMNPALYIKEKDYIFSLYYLNFFSFSKCFDFSLNSKMSTFANQRTINISNMNENEIFDNTNSYLLSLNKNLSTNTFNCSSKMVDCKPKVETKIQKNKIKRKISNAIQQNEVFGWTGFYSPFEGEILFNEFYNSLKFRQTFVNSASNKSILKEPLNIMSFSFISRFNKIKKQVTDANIKLLKNSSSNFIKKSNLLMNELVKFSSTHKAPNQKNYNFSKNDILLLTKTDIFTLNLPCNFNIKTCEVNIKGLIETTKYKNQINLKTKIKNNTLLNTLINRYQTFLHIETMILDELKASNEKILSDMSISRNIIKYRNEKYQIKKLRIGSLNPYPKLRLASFLLKHDPISNQSVTKKSGQIIHLSSSSLTLRNAQPITISNRGSLYYQNGDFITKNSPVVTLPFQTLKTGDIVQGIPKVEQILEARTTRGGRLFLQSLPVLLQCLFERYSQTYPFDVAVRKSILKIQQLIVDAIQRVYRSQGVSIADKHVEIIVRQMTMKVQIIHPGYTGFFPGELINLETIEFLNQALLTKVKYAPIVLGISKAALEVDSFLSAASFQYTTKVLTKAALFRKKDFLKGLKENLLVGNLLPAGTGYFVYLQDQKDNK